MHKPEFLRYFLATKEKYFQMLEKYMHAYIHMVFCNILILKVEGRKLVKCLLRKGGSKDVVRNKTSQQQFCLICENQIWCPSTNLHYYLKPLTIYTE